MYSMHKLVSKIFSTISADAHCDIPCGVYDPTPAKIAAKTVVRMVQQLDEIKPPEGMDAHAIATHANMISRRITWSTNQYLLSPFYNFMNGRDQGCCFSGSRWAMDQGNVVRVNNGINRIILRLIQHFIMVIVYI